MDFGSAGGKSKFAAPLSLTVTWRTHTYTIKKLTSNSTVLDLKRALHESTSIPVDNQKLMIKGRYSKDSATLGECGATSTTKILLLATDRAAIDEMHEKERIEAQRREEERIKQVEAQREVELRMEQERAVREEAAQLERARLELQQAEAQRAQQEERRWMYSSTDGTPPGHVQTTLAVHSAAFSRNSSKIDENSNKIILPDSMLKRVLENRAQAPYTFKLSYNDGSVIATVLEFTGENDAAYTPYWMLQTLGAQEGASVQFETVVLPKGEFAKLQPDEFKWLLVAEEQRKSVLESELRKRQTLSLNEKVTITFGRDSYTFHVIELAPAESVSIIDSDLTVDILEPVTASQHQHTVLNPLQTIASALPSGGFAFYKLEINDPSVVIVLELGMDQGSATMYIDTRRAFPTPSEHQWSSEKDGISVTPSLIRLIIDQQDPQFVVGPYFIGVFSPFAEAKIKITASDGRSSGIRLDSNGSGSSQALHANGAPGADADTTLCSNCMKFIPRVSLSMHSLQCQRMNWKCPICNAVVPTKDKEVHLQVAHAKLKCPQCHEYEGEKTEVELHRVYECRDRPFECPYCSLSVPYSQRGTHMRDCGSRTSACPTCNKNIKLRDLKTHVEESHPETLPHNTETDVIM